MSEPQQARDAEVSLLGAAMSGYSDLDELAAVVEREDFYQPFHQDVWSAILRVHRAGNKPDPVSVRLALSAAEVKHDPVRLLDFTQMVPIVSSAPFYAEQVATAAGLRAIHEAGKRLQGIGEGVAELDEARELARQTVDDATRGRAVSKARSIADLLPQVIDTAQFGQTNVLPTGWSDLDRTIGGLAPGRLVVFGARPGVGKSLALTNIALHFAHVHQHAVLFSSLEMPEDEVGQRMLAAFAGVNLTGLQMGTTDERSWERIARSSAELGGLPITIDDTPGQTVTSIRRAARNVQRTRDDLALILVDYLQLVTPANTDPRASRAEKVTQISRDLKLLARETGACVVAAVQVNREGTKHAHGRPTMNDLREGGIENDADQVILLHQPDDELPEIEVITEKNRHGPKGIATLQVQGHYARLVSVHWTPTSNLRGAG